MTYRARIPLPNGNRVTRHVVQPYHQHGCLHGTVFIAGSYATVFSKTPDDPESWEVLRIEADRLSLLHRDGVSSAY